jgi:AbrB family looped-hinge helix DNA binding protein
MVLMKSATRVTSKGQVVIPKPVREQLRWASGTQLAVEILAGGAVRLTLLAAEDAIDTLYGCLKDLPRDPLADLEAEHRAEIAAEERWQRRGP